MNAHDMVMNIKKESASGTLYVARNERGDMVEYFGDVYCEGCGAFCKAPGGTPWMAIPGMSIAELISIADREVARYELPEIDYNDDGEECCSLCIC